MGNKSGKFNVPATEKVKDEEVVNDAEGKVESSNMVEANGDQSKHDTNVGDKTENAEEPEAKKKNIISWFKKVSLRKEKKSKAPKANGVKEEIAETPKENGVELNETKENGNCEIQSENVEPKEEIAEVNHEEKETPTEVTDNKDETPIANGHSGNETENPETPNEQ